MNNIYYSSGKQSILSAISSGIHSKVFNFGSSYWKTKEQRKQGISDNIKQLKKDFIESFNKKP